MDKTDWELRPEGDRMVLTRYETPLGLWLLDRWFRFPEAIFDWIEWRYPRTAAITGIPCRLYARCYPELIVRNDHGIRRR